MSESVPLDQLAQPERRLETAVFGDPDLGPFALLPGTWGNDLSQPVPRGWNMSALPIPLAGSGPGAPANTGTHPGFRLLVNRYQELLRFNLVDKKVPNRGIKNPAPNTVDATQTVVTIDYEQSIIQELADDRPFSGLAGSTIPIHHEPGLFLAMSDPLDRKGPNIARLATIPHGDAALGLGNSRVDEAFDADTIPTINALPLGVPQDLAHPYLEPYAHYHQNPFDGVFDPTDPTALLKLVAANTAITRTTVLEFDTTVPDAGINNIPFIVDQANASEMKATFFVHELEETGPDGQPKLMLQYAQIVQLDFFPRFDGGPGRIKWPHVSINTMVKLSNQPDFEPAALVQARA